MIVSVHLPKTGGSSFRSMLQAHFGEHLLLDYDDRPLAHSAEDRNAAAERSAQSKHVDLQQSYACIHGHFLPRKYLGLDDATFVTWMRDPVERVVSRYFYTKRRWQELGELPQHPRLRELYDRKGSYPDLAEFVQIPDFQNTYAQYLWHFSLDNFACIGIVEKWQVSLDRMAAVIGFDTSMDTKLNVNPSRADNIYEIDDDLRTQIAECNAEDARLYERALTLSA